MAVNRKRKIRTEMRLTEDEHDILLERMRGLGMTNKDSYLRRMALTGYILRLDMSEARETLRQISGIANNINQIAKRVNETRSIYASDMIQIREEVGSLRSQMSDALKLFRKVQKFMEL